ncbi:MAG TPA: hypothetical protein VGF48_24735 [Thermoanaerobaculia bacterium]|jgi:hypothetical protein
MTLHDQLQRRFPKLKRLPPGCYIVGGAIRDLLLGREPLDVDIAAPDAEAAARAIRPRTIRLGRDDRTAYRVVESNRVYDVAAIEGGDVDRDLARRDFTINAMAIDVAGGELLDPHGGRDDLARRRVRMVQAKNFDDDPLRLLKAVRMAIRYDFAIEEETAEAIRSRAETIVNVAPERVTYELSIILGSNAFRRAVALLRELGFASPLALDTTRDYAADDVSLAGAFALLVNEPRAYAEQWRWSEGLVREVLALQRLTDTHDRIALYDAGESIARQLPAVLRALGRDEQLDWPDFSIRALLTGEELGLPPGRALGARKRRLLEAQIRGEITTREEAEAWLRSNPTAT